MGIYTIFRGVIEMVLEPSLESFMADVRQGTLDFTFIKPEDAQFLVSVRQVQIWKLIDVALGLIVLAVALMRLRVTIGIWQAVTFVGMLLAGGVTIYSFLLILATCSFWFIRVDNLLVIFMSMYTAGRWPVNIYPAWLRSTLTFLVPVAFAITVPAEALIGRLTWQMLLSSVALTLVLLVASRWFWTVGVRHYSGASA